MKKNTIKHTLLFLFFMIPVVSSAALEGVVKLVDGFGTVLAAIIPVLVGLAVIYFFWGIGQFILHDAGNDKAREDGKKKILWGVIALFVMVSLWGITAWIGQVVGIEVPATDTSSSIQNSSDQGDACWPECSDGRGGCFPCN